MITLSSPPLLTLDHVTGMRGATRILQPTSFNVQAGERIAILGANGAGKSTLLKRLAGLIEGEGVVSLMGSDEAALSRIERARRLAYLPQEATISWRVPVARLVTLGRLPHGVDLDCPSTADKAAIEEAMVALDVEKWRTRPANTLSMGEQARVLVARALAGQAPILLADEPVSALDPRHQIGVLKALKDYAAQGRAVLAVMHDLTLAAQWASRVFLMQAGSIIYDATPQQALTPAQLDPLFGITTRCINAAGQSVITFCAD